MPSSNLYISVYDEQSNDLNDVEITIYQNQELILKQKSDTNPHFFVLDAKPKQYSFDPFFPEPYRSYDIEVQKTGYLKEIRNDVRVFEDIDSTLEIVMVKINA
jgi:hypothetical protein